MMQHALTIPKLPDRFFIDLAVGVLAFDELCLKYGLDPADVRQHQDDSLFLQRAQIAAEAVNETGQAWRARCRMLAHRALPHMSVIVEDSEAPASARIEAFKTLVKYGDLEPRQTQTAGQGGTMLNLTIVAPGGDHVESYNLLGTPSPKDRPALEHHSIDMDDVAWVEV